MPSVFCDKMIMMMMMMMMMITTVVVTKITMKFVILEISMNLKLGISSFLTGRSSSLGSATGWKGHRN